ncbi:hypothetical protein X797_011025 [Metarhizium robertsii]|uniref:Short-chain dehydrogenase/reductase SDR n=2 Tax=Metarhizium robertsii TaxID=568076 RepID=A0A0B2X715_METRA|nr:Short-chain dehydrogenase/reductase SDR [Metarhizium robertsii ARSEF 23]EXU95903.1 hypothetical protein X797_011025 [Metarhizium robertsii]KHO10673.1 Short-chain dehydrogenase/reductase SDR [Metarhizium robertsii ARSEF 23]
MPLRSQHSTRRIESSFPHSLVALFLLAFPHLSAAAGVIIYPWDKGPLSANSYGAVRTTWGSNDCVNMSWTSSTSTPSQSLHLECNQGPNGTAPPWTRVWTFNSTASSGNGSNLFCVANCNPPPPVSNTCRFVLDIAFVSGESSTDTAYSPDVSLNIIDRKTGESTTYPLPQWTATGTVTTSTSTSTASVSASTTIASPSSSSNSASSLSTSAKAGIGVGVGVVGVILIACLGIFLHRRRMTRIAGTTPSSVEAAKYNEKNTEPSKPTPQELDETARPVELPANSR